MSPYGIMSASPDAGSSPLRKEAKPRKNTISSIVSSINQKKDKHLKASPSQAGSSPQLLKI